jgi:hypothetical protein
LRVPLGPPKGKPHHGLGRGGARARAGRRGVLLFVALSIVLLMAPAAYHRIVYKGEDSEEFHRIGSRFVSYSTIPLALGLAADVFVVVTKIVPSELVSAIAAVAVLALLLGLWQGLPRLARRRRGPARLQLRVQSP